MPHKVLRYYVHVPALDLIRSSRVAFTHVPASYSHCPPPPLLPLPSPLSTSSQYNTIQLLHNNYDIITSFLEICGSHGRPLLGLIVKSCYQLPNIRQFPPTTAQNPRLSHESYEPSDNLSAHATQLQAQVVELDFKSTKRWQRALYLGLRRRRPFDEPSLFLCAPQPRTAA